MQRPAAQMTPADSQRLPERIPSWPRRKAENQAAETVEDGRGEKMGRFVKPL